jgi:RHS repeat-associated protein
VKRTLNGVTTYYVYDGEKPILEYNLAGHLVGWNLYGKGIDEIIERVTYSSSNAWVAYFPQQDHEGSVIAITDANGAILEYYRYDVFGAPSIYGGPPNWTQRSATAYNNRFLFTGREYAATYQNTYIPAFGFYEYRARAYNPGLGRFMSEDPKLFDAGDYNLFRYCHNDPIDFTDPMGLLPNMPYHWTPELMSAMDRLWAMTQWFDRSNIMQGNFAGFASQSDRDAKGGFVMGQISRTEARMYSYALRPGYSIGDLAGARGYQYVSDPDPNCTGQCLTGVQHLTRTPSSRTPLVAGEAVGPNTRQGTAIAKGWVPQNGRYIYPSRPAGVSNNHAAIFVAQIGSRHMQILSQYNISPMQRAPLHFEVVPTSGWNVITSGLPARSASTSELRAWDGSVLW